MILTLSEVNSPEYSRTAAGRALNEFMFYETDTGAYIYDSIREMIEEHLYGQVNGSISAWEITTDPCVDDESDFIKTETDAICIETKTGRRYISDCELLEKVIDAQEAYEAAEDDCWPSLRIALLDEMNYRYNTDTERIEVMQ